MRDKNGSKLSMTFSHPLARGASMFTANDSEGNKQPVLVIVTTLALDPESNKYKMHYVEKLSSAARKYLTGLGQGDRVRSHEQTP